MADDDYKFPHEIEEEAQEQPKAVEDDIDIDVSAESDVDIEIEDDTPPQDRGRRPLDREVEDPPDEEVEQ